MMASTAQFETHQIILWHEGSRRQPVPGVVVIANDDKHTATIKIRDLSGKTLNIKVDYDEIEVRS